MTNFNSKAASKSLLYLQTNYDGSYEKLAQAADEMSAHSRSLNGQMAAAQKRLEEIETHRAAKRAFNELGLEKLPLKKALDAEYSKVLTEKKSLYAAYCEEQRKLKELLVHRENLRPYLAPQEPQTQKRAGRALIVLRKAPKVRCHIALRYVFWGLGGCFSLNKQSGNPAFAGFPRLQEFV